MKRLLLTGITAIWISIFALCVYGAEVITLDAPNIVETTVSIEGETAYAAEEVIVVVAQEGETPKDEKAVYFAGQTQSDYAGRFSLVFDMSEINRETGMPLLSGRFTAYASSASGQASYDFEYVNPRAKTLILEQINKSRQDSAALKTLLDSEDNRMTLRTMCMIDEYTQLDTAHKGKVCDIICEKQMEFTEDTWRFAANDAIAAILMNRVSSRKDILGVLQKDEIRAFVNLEFDGVTYEKASEAEQEFFCDVILDAVKNRQFCSMKEIETLYEQAMVLYRLNNTGYLLAYDEVIEPWAEVLLLAENTDFKYLQSSDTTVRDAVMKNLKMPAQDFMSVEEFTAALRSAVKTYRQGSSTPGKNNGVSGGGGGGGGSSHGGFSSPVLPEQTDKPSAEKEEIEFSDLESTVWAKEGILTLAKKGIINGVGGGRFEPGRLVTRAEFIKMLMVVFNFTDNKAECSFEDVKAGDWCYPYIAAAQRLGITSGISETEFGTEQMITRQEMAVFAHRASVRAFLPVTDTEGEKFDDEEYIEDWAQRSVSLMRGAGIISGVGGNYFNPRANATRAESAMIIYNLYRVMQQY